MGSEQNAGFTLLELSIVLVIIGLIVGGVLVGRDLIEVAELKRIQTDVALVTTGVETFRTKYNCLPGDCSNATSLLTAGHCDGTIESSAAVCNGDGDGVIGGSGTGADSAGFHQWENFYLWRTLNAAGLTPFTVPGSNYVLPWSTWMGVLDNSSTARGSYPNAVMYITNTYVAGTIDGVGWGWTYPFMPADYTNALMYAAAGGSGLGANGGLLTSAEAQAFDSKFDDGYANSGKVIGDAYPVGQCANPTSAAPVRYVPQGTWGTTGNCGLVFLNPF